MTLIAETTVIASPTNTNSSSGISGGAAAGIAIGILALIAIGAAVFFVVRRRRRDEYQRQYDPSNLSSSPGSLNRPFGTDQRLEPQMLQKRESVGSLADENDYSRKILRVISSTARLTLGDQSRWELGSIIGEVAFERWMSFFILASLGFDHSRTVMLRILVWLQNRGCKL